MITRGGAHALRLAVDLPKPLERAAAEQVDAWNIRLAGQPLALSGAARLLALGAREDPSLTRRVLFWLPLGEPAAAKAVVEVSGPGGLKDLRFEVPVPLDSLGRVPMRPVVVRDRSKPGTSPSASEATARLMEASTLLERDCRLTWDIGPVAETEAEGVADTPVDTQAIIFEEPGDPWRPDQRQLFIDAGATADLLVPKQIAEAVEGLERPAVGFDVLLFPKVQGISYDAGFTLAHATLYDHEACRSGEKELCWWAAFNGFRTVQAWDPARPFLVEDAMGNLVVAPEGAALIRSFPADELDGTVQELSMLDVLAHEVGHVLGLAHEDFGTENNVMFGKERCADVSCLSRQTFAIEQCLLVQENWNQRVAFDERVSVEPSGT